MTVPFGTGWGSVSAISRGRGRPVRVDYPVLMSYDGGYPTAVHTEGRDFDAVSHHEEVAIRTFYCGLSIDRAGVSRCGAAEGPWHHGVRQRRVAGACGRSMSW